MDAESNARRLGNQLDRAQDVDDSLQLDRALPFDAAQLTDSWRQSRPFKHLVLDGILEGDALNSVCAAVSRQPHWPLVDEVATVMASAPSLEDPKLLAVQSAMQDGAIARLLGDVTGLTIDKLLLRSYVYLPGHDLLPHSDFRPGLGRVLAAILYLRADERGGGVLRLFADGQRQPTVEITPKAGRLVVFEVSRRAIHSVAPVTSGARVSLAGWYYAPSVDPLAATDAPPMPKATQHIAPQPCPAKLLDWLAAQLHPHIRGPGVLQAVDEPTRGRFDWAQVPLASDETLALLRHEAGATFLAASALLGAVFLRQKDENTADPRPKGAILSKALAELRPPQARYTVAVCLPAGGCSAERPAAKDAAAVTETSGCELVWHGSHGVVAVHPATPGTWSVVQHRDDVGIYARRGAYPPSAHDELKRDEAAVERLLIWMG